MQIRPATADDFPRLAELARQMHGESLIQQPPIDEQHGYNLFMAVLSVSTACFYVAEEKEIVGFIVGAVTPTLFSSRPIGLHDILYVQPESRRGRTGILLIREFMRFCIEHSAYHITLSHNAVDPRVGKLYERLGFKKTGEAYTWQWER